MRQVDFLHPDGWREVIWRLTDGSYKARLALLNTRGERRVGYDWHYGTSAHRHYGEEQAPYVFTTIEALLDDFSRDVDRMK